MSSNKLLILVSVLTSILILSFSVVLIGCGAQDKKVVKIQEPVKEKEAEKETEVAIDKEVTEVETAEEIAVEESVPDKSDYLTVADVEKVSGVQGIQVVSYNPCIGAGGDINFALSDGTMFLLAQNQPDSLFEEWRKGEDFFNEPIANLGDEAYSAPGSFDYQYIVCCLKKPYAVGVSSFFNESEGGKPYFTQEQLIELTRIILSRL